MPIQLGIVGTGGMAHTHARKYAELAGVRLAACCDVEEERATAFARTHGIPRVYTDYRAMLRMERLDGISVVTPDSSHAKVSMTALQQGVGVLCEKPLAATVREAEAMAAAAGRSGVPNMVNFSKRDSAAVQQARRVVSSGALGRVMHLEASYLQSWLVHDYWGDWRKEHKWLWRLSDNHGSTGVLGDLGCHIYDMACFVCGDFARLYCSLQTFDKASPLLDGDYDLKANDSFSAVVSLENGALGSIHASRWATGHKNREYLRVFGDKGALSLDFEVSTSSYQIRGKDPDEPWRTVACKATPSNYQRFVKALKTGNNDECDFAQGLKIQRYLDASLRAAKTGRTVSLAESIIKFPGRTPGGRERRSA